MHPILGLLIVVLALFAASWYKRAPPATRSVLLRKLIIYGGVGLLLVLVLTGRLNPVFALLGGLVPLVYRASTLLRLFRTVGGSPGNTHKAPGISRVRSKYLEMTLEHESGSMQGSVLDGPHRGRSLSTLGLVQLLELMSFYNRSDGQSAALLEAFIDQAHPKSDWRTQSGHASGDAVRHAPDRMTTVVARDVLGVSVSATEKEIIVAHRRLMQRLHPDRGGSDYLAATVNQAKDVLLRERQAN